MPMSDLRRPILPARLLFEEGDVARSSQFMEAVVAAYVIVAQADGEVASAERRKLMSLARHDPLLAAFSRNDIAEELAIHEANYELDNEVASEIAAEKLEPMHKHPREAKAIVEAARAAIPADGIAHPAEFRALAKVKHILRVLKD